MILKIGVKFEKKTDLWFGKWHEEFRKILPVHTKVSKMGLWCDAFVQFKKCMSLKFIEELYVITMKNDTQIEEELTWWIWRTLTRVFESLKNLNRLLLTNAYVSAKKVQRSSFMTLNSDAKFEQKLTCGLKNDMRNLANFHQSTWKCKNWDFDGIFLSKVEKVWP